MLKYSTIALLALLPAAASAEALAVSLGANFDNGTTAIDTDNALLEAATIESLAISAATAGVSAVANATAANAPQMGGLSGANANAGASADSTDAVSSTVNINLQGQFSSEVMIGAAD